MYNNNHHLEALSFHKSRTANFKKFVQGFKVKMYRQGPNAHGLTSQIQKHFIT